MAMMIFGVEGYINTVLVAIALGFALAWPRHRGSWLLPLSLLMLLLSMVGFLAVNLLLRSGVSDTKVGLANIQVLARLIPLGNVLAYALLVAFVIVWRRRAIEAVQGSIASETDRSQFRGLKADDMSRGAQALSSLRKTFWLLGSCLGIVALGFIVAFVTHNIVMFVVLLLIALAVFILGTTDAQRGIQMSRIARGKDPITALGCLTYLITPIGLIAWSIIEYRALCRHTVGGSCDKAEAETRQPPPAN